MKTKLESNREEISRKVDKYWVPMIVHLDGGGDKATSQAAAAGAFKSRPRKKVLVVGINDESAIGAVEAGKETANGTEIAIVGHGGSMEIMDIVANPASPCIGTVFFHAERYGTDLLSFALPMVRGRSAPVAHYVPHEFMGNDALLRMRREALARPS